MSIGGVLALLLLASVDAQHLFLAGGGLTIESDFFWYRLIQFSVKIKCYSLTIWSGAIMSASSLFRVAKARLKSASSQQEGRIRKRHTKNSRFLFKLCCQWDNPLTYQRHFGLPQTIFMSHGARHVTWIAVSGSVEESGNNETLAGMVMKQSAIFIDDGDVHRLVRLLRNADGSGNS